MTVPLKYAVVERERRFLLSGLPTRVPTGLPEPREIVDHYVLGTRLRLREVRETDGSVTRKLGHKVRLGDGPAEVACTNAYLDAAEWDVLAALPTRTLRKTRYVVEHGPARVAIDVHADGTVLAEIDDGDGEVVAVPTWLDVVADVSTDETWTGARLAGLPEE